MHELAIPELHLTPGGLRGGGAIHFHRKRNDKATLQWHMRVASQETVRHFLQEVMARNQLAHLSRNKLVRLRMLASFFEPLLAWPDAL